VAAGPAARRAPAERAVTRRLTPGAVGALVGAVLGLLTLGPALRPGYALSYDMVFVPHPPITAAVLGTDGGVPRAVPNDLVVALLSSVLPGDVVQKLLLLAVFVLGGWGVARLVPGRVPAVVAAAVFLWNPYVLERLVIGHWGFLLGYAALPWVVGAAESVRACRPGALPRLAVAVSVAGLAGSTSLVLAAAAAFAVVVAPGDVPHRGRALLVVVGAAVLSGAAWLVPALTRSGGLASDPAGVGAFATRADTPLGVVGSALTLGGLWSPATWPGERSSAVLAILALVAVVAAVGFGIAPLLRARGGGAVGLAGLAVVCLVLALAGSLPGGRTVLEHVVVNVPGGGLLRDGQKLLAPVALLVAVCAGYAVDRVHPAYRAVAVLAAAVPIVLLPSQAWGVHARLAAVDYPASWLDLQRTVAAQPGSQRDTVVLPFHLYRRYGWNDDRVLLDPAPRLLDARVVVDDTLPLSTATVRGEDPRADRVRAAIRSGADLGPALAREGIGLVLVQTDQPDPEGVRDRVADLPVVWSGGDLELRRVPGAVAPARTTRLPVGLLLAGLGLAAALVATLVSARRHRCYSRQTRSGRGRTPHGERS